MRTNLHLGWADRLGVSGTRLRIRLAAGALALANAVVYALIGAGVAVVVEDAASADVSLAVFGAMAGAAFLLGAVLLWSLDNRLVWLAGAAFQVFAIVAYFDVAPQRTPAYEPWGISLKVAQAALLVLLAYLAVTPAKRVRVRRSAT
ncbi:MAG TPA: hypothetical protein VKB31_04285 [Trueperaceae bacterium]|nr:hypothetical protein [Trueperaceae bacterium]